MVEGVSLVASGFQFFTRLGSVFAKESGDFGLSSRVGPIYRGFARIINRVHFRNISDKQFYNFLVAKLAAKSKAILPSLSFAFTSAPFAIGGLAISF